MRGDLLPTSRLWLLSLDILVVVYFSWINLSDSKFISDECIVLLCELLFDALKLTSITMKAQLSDPKFQQLQTEEVNTVMRLREPRAVLISCRHCRLSRVVQPSSVALLQDLKACRSWIRCLV